jgi:1,4-alpha-glucan branching enzyme
MAVSLAIVLHAHLPYVREAEPWSWSERWFHEAMWECYLPLLAVIDRLAADGVPAPLTLSISPPLLSLMRDPLMAERFDAHLAVIDAKNERFAGEGVKATYREALADARATWRACDRDLVGALLAHARANRIELMTTSASHAFLPALRPVDGARAQLALGAASFAALTGLPEPLGRWIPECAIDESVLAAMAATGARYTTVEAEAVELARPRMKLQPIVSPEGIVLFPRNRDLCERVWSRHAGYPGCGDYREFHRDIGFELGRTELDPFEAGAMTGLKYFAIDGTRYDALRARVRAQGDAGDFVRRAAAHDGLVVAAYDAELFGHWWFEGPIFLERVCRLAADRGVVLTTLQREFVRGDFPVATPNPSSWGEQGSFRAWVGTKTARAWRRIHRLHRQVTLAAAEGHPRASDAIRELMLLESSDWLFMIATTDAAGYGEQRLLHHSARVAAILQSEPVPATPFLAELAPRSTAEGFAAGVAGPGTS